LGFFGPLFAGLAEILRPAAMDVCAELGVFETPGVGRPDEDRY
jgi:hypothetical protein